ncbi:MAG: hypothetical protein U5L72_05860 [Bacteroidales bacterium]|nr:hypothetical protein [Bacteroidales bacterium]
MKVILLYDLDPASDINKINNTGIPVRSFVNHCRMKELKHTSRN